MSRPLPFNRGRTTSIRYVAWVGPLKFVRSARPSSCLFASWSCRWSDL